MGRSAHPVRKNWLDRTLMCAVELFAMAVRPTDVAEMGLASILKSFPMMGLPQRRIRR